MSFAVESLMGEQRMKRTFEELSPSPARVIPRAARAADNNLMESSET